MDGRARLKAGAVPTSISLRVDGAAVPIACMTGSGNDNPIRVIEVFFDKLDLVEVVSGRLDPKIRQAAMPLLSREPPRSGQDHTRELCDEDPHR
jgi:hypothetical protein